MSAPRWSKGRLGVPSDGNGSEKAVARTPTTKRSSTNTFSISYAVQRPGNSRASMISQRPIMDSSEGEGDIPSSEEGESELEAEDRTGMAAAPTSSTTNNTRPTTGTSVEQFQQTPHFSRTMSMPLPSQLGHLQHPHRTQMRTIYSSSTTPHHPFSPMNLLSIELADSFQMVIQTMLQISPPQILEPTKEQYSACSLSVPTPSMSAMFTAMKTLNYMSANLLRFYSSESESLGYSDGDAKGQNVFDIGELLQAVGDTLSGVAAQAGVDLVLYHGEVGVRHVYVKGDECGISYALLYITRQILDKAHPGDLIELGLAITLHGVQSGTQSIPGEGVQGRVTASPVDMDSLRCGIKIEHKYGPSIPPDPNEGHVENRGINGETPKERERMQPRFTGLLLRRLLRLIDAQFTIGDGVEDGQVYEVSLLLDKAASPTVKAPASLSGSGVLQELSGTGTDLSVEQLLAFGETLKGRKVTLFGTTANAFTRHITNYLTAWGMDVSSMFSDSSSEASPDEGTPTPMQESRFSTPTIPVAHLPEAAATSTSRPTESENEPQISFVLIDDDVGILRERLHALRAEQYPLNLNAHTRPSLAALHRPRSSPQIARIRGQSTPPLRSIRSVVILHFTSLANFKVTKDAIQTALSIGTGSATFIPEVMIIPKPIGPRRFLTAMHTAVTRPTIDPFFLPTATSPGTPGAQLSGSFFPPPSDPDSNNQTPQTGSPFPRVARPPGSRPNSDRSTKEHVFTNIPSPSPLGNADNTEYFPDPAGKLGLSPSSGYLVSSPDGQPAGILFHPRSKKNASPQSLERSTTQTTVQQRGSIPRLFSGREGDAMSFSALHEVSHSPPASTEMKTPSESPKATGSPTTPVTRDPIPTSGRRSTPESPGNENGLAKNAVGKRPAHEKQASMGKGVGVTTGKKGKTLAPSDGHIVPPISVLIVDDNPINQNILSTFMKRKKIRYGIANNGKEAVEQWKTGGFHLILMDIQMPVMDGIEATREIRNLEKMNAISGFPPVTPPIPSTAPTSPFSMNETRPTSAPTSASSPYRSSVIIVALTASSLQSDRVSALAAGCNDFLTKPVSLLWLNNKIIEWGSIKALQMWADDRPEAVRKISRDQVAQARAVAERLHMPPRNRKSPSGRPSVSEKSASPNNSSAGVVASTAVAAEYLTKPMFQDPVDEAPASGPSFGAEAGAPSFSGVPKRRRSQKRDKAPEFLKVKTAEVSAEAHDVTARALPINNGGPPVPSSVEQEKAHCVLPSKEPKNEVQPKSGLVRTPLIESSGSGDYVPPPQPPILRPG